MTELTNSEMLIMKCIWDYGEDIPLSELREILLLKHGKDWKRTTLRTFLLHLEQKGYVSSYQVGRNTCIHALQNGDEFMAGQTEQMLELWYGGSASNLIATLGKRELLSREELEKIRGILDVLDD